MLTAPPAAVGSKGCRTQAFLPFGDGKTTSVVGYFGGGCCLEREVLTQVSVAGGVLDSDLTWKIKMCDHILHAKFKMLIPITSIKKQTSLIKEKSWGGIAVMRKSI